MPAPSDRCVVVAARAGSVRTGADDVRAQQCNDAPATRRQLAILALESSDVVRMAGGLIFDRVRAGWDVQVYLTDPRRTSGAGHPGRSRVPRAAQLQHWARQSARHRGGSDIYAHAPRLRRVFATHARRHQAEFAIWGGSDDGGAYTRPGWSRVEHRLSQAARAFKPHALVAAGVSPDVTPTELFCGGSQFADGAAPLFHLG